jgi:hypothetical protein
MGLLFHGLFVCFFWGKPYFLENWERQKNQGIDGKEKKVKMG